MSSADSRGIHRVDYKLQMLSPFFLQAKNRHNILKHKYLPLVW